MVYGYKGDLHSNLMAKVLEHCIVKIVGVTDCDVSRDTIAVDDIWPK
jgi:hypothetical protein